ncbi:MAG: molybdenum cofactor guanylyltransferase [Deltaproteobacteria bacterium]|nr:MAG: molybdenum cofactor guanylyltransferase [Deltaproteobacteria bacterium]
MQKAITGAILAGDLNRRFNGQPKAFIEINGQTIIERLYRLFKELFAEVIIVTNRPALFTDFGCLIATDLFPARASLTGIHAGLFYARHDHLFVSACDTPFLKKGLVKVICDAAHLPGGVTMPVTATGQEPLCALYTKKCLPLMEKHIALNQLKIRSVFGKKWLHEISERRLRQADRDLISFYNINRPEDMERAKRLVGDGEVSP